MLLGLPFFYEIIYASHETPIDVIPSPLQWFPEKTT